VHLPVALGKGRLAPALFLLSIVLGSSCAGAPPLSQESRSQGVIQWEPLKRWTGRGDQQLDSFQSDSGALRIEWEATRTPGATAPGSLKIVMHSAISGRPLGTAVVDHSGEGKGTAYFSEEPRVFFMNVSSAGVEWTIAVSERVR
jgi:hypothetical protein